jgi:hypothetical protein
MHQPPQLAQFLNHTVGQSSSSVSNKSNKKPMKKKKITGRTQLPPMNLTDRVAAEQKIEELQRMATANSQFIRSQSASIVSDISGSEAEFLARHNNISNRTLQFGTDVESQSTNILQSPSRLGEPSLELVDRGQRVGTTIVIGTLKEKIEQLEQQLQQLQSNLRNQDNELEKKDKRIRSLSHDLEKLKSDANSEMKRLQYDVSIIINIIIIIMNLFACFSMKWNY